MSQIPQIPRKGFFSLENKKMPNRIKFKVFRQESSEDTYYFCKGVRQGSTSSQCHREDAFHNQQEKVRPFLWPEAQVFQDQSHQEENDSNVVKVGLETDHLGR